jgi:transglutaminase-like putative cysteine protease
MIYRIVHNTTYEYVTPAEACHNLLRLDPRTMPGQRCLETSLEIEPAPAKVHAYLDYFGNQVRSYSLIEPHDKLSITSHSRVEVDRSKLPAPTVSGPWNPSRPATMRDRDRATIDALEYVYDSVYIRTGPRLADYAVDSFSPGRPLVEAANDLTARIFRDFSYDPEATTIDTSVEDVLERRRGVCQDFAHLEIGCLRSLGLAARYVSGYLRTDNAPGQPRMEGADASHAWVSVWCPQNGWVDFDPTNGCLTGDRHVVLGWGRDFHDVSPVKGVVLGGSGSSLSVAVEVVAVEA